jgi:hypothetical protein
VHATTSRPLVTVTTDGRGVAAHAGSRLLADLADAAGLSAAFGLSWVRWRVSSAVDRSDLR